VRGWALDRGHRPPGTSLTVLLPLITDKDSVTLRLPAAEQLHLTPHSQHNQPALCHTGNTGTTVQSVKTLCIPAHPGSPSPESTHAANAAVAQPALAYCSLLNIRPQLTIDSACCDAWSSTHPKSSVHSFHQPCYTGGQTQPRGRLAGKDFPP
jgi:hypothetical protein